MDLGAVKYLTKIETQCAHYANDPSAALECVTSYYVTVKTSTDASDVYTDVCFTDPSCPQLFVGNSAASSSNLDLIAANEFDWLVAARFVRLSPQDFIYWPTMRWEVYGCDYY